MRLTVILAGALLAGQAAAAPQAVLLSGEALGGKVFDDPRTQTTQESSETGTATARDFVAHEAADGCLQTGVYEIGRNRFTITEPYPHDEFMYFLSGGVTLSATDGSVTEAKAGDGVLLPKGWTGVWDSPGYRKIYVIRSVCKTAP